MACSGVLRDIRVSAPRLGVVQPRATLGWASLVSLIIGIAGAWELDVVGVLYCGEVLAAVVCGWALLINIGNRNYWRAPFSALLVCLMISLIGYVISDLIWQTGTRDLLRGWARILVLGSNFVALYSLCRKNAFNLLIYCVASAIGALLHSYVEGALWVNWKFGASVPLTLLVACVASRLTPGRVLLAAMGLGGMGLAHVFLDYRSLGGCCLVGSAILFARHLAWTRRKSLFCVSLGLSIVAGCGALLYVYAATDEAYRQRRLQSNAWRAAAVLTAMDGISRSPWIGNGSWATNFEFQSQYDSIFSDLSGARYRGLQTGAAVFAPHSQILQVWFEAGILGMTFFWYLGYRMAAAVKYCVLARNLDDRSALFIFCLLSGMWHLLFSPFAGPARTDVAICAVITCLVDIERQRPGLGSDRP